MISPNDYLVVAGILFSLGLLGLLIRRNLILVLLSVELMLNAANLVFVTGSFVHGQADGQVNAFFVMVIAAAEVTIGLAIAVLLFRKTGNADTHDIRWLKG